MVAVLFISLIIFMALGVPIAASIGFATLASMISGGSGNLFLVAQKMITAMDSTTLLAIPLFILAGAIMGKGGISKRIIDLSYPTITSCHFRLLSFHLLGVLEHLQK